MLEYEETIDKSFAVGLLLIQTRRQMSKRGRPMKETPLAARKRKNKAEYSA